MQGAEGRTEAGIRGKVIHAAAEINNLRGNEVLRHDDGDHGDHEAKVEAAGSIAEQQEEKYGEAECTGGTLPDEEVIGIGLADIAAEEQAGLVTTHLIHPDGSGDAAGRLEEVINILEVPKGGEVGQDAAADPHSEKKNDEPPDVDHD